MKADKEVLPNPADTFQSLRYLQDQAAKKSFEGHTSAYIVMLYLTMNMWVRTPNTDDAGIGQVFYGRSRIRDIVRYTTLSERAVQYALKWLAEEGWLETERTFASNGREDRRYIMLMLDQRAHVSRERRRNLDAELAQLGREGATDAHREGATDAPS